MATSEDRSSITINVLIAPTKLPPDPEDSCLEVAVFSGTLLDFTGLQNLPKPKFCPTERLSSSKYMTESVMPHLPVKDLFVESKKCARSRYQYGRCDFIYNQMHIEQDATPMGLWMQTGDSVALVPTFGKLSCQLKSRKTLGLNLCLGETEGGLPFPKEVIKHGQTDTAEQSDRNLMANMKKLAFSFYVGPVRNSTPENAHAALPIVQLVPFDNDSTVDELVESWAFYVRERGINVKDTPTFVLHRDKKIVLGKNTMIKDVFDPRMQRHYFCLPPGKEATNNRPSVDDENIDKLVECIKLVEEDANSAATGAKRKKKKPGQRQGSELDMRNVPEVRHNPGVKQNPEVERDLMINDSEFFDEDANTDGIKRKKTKKGRAYCKVQKKEKAESLRTDQVPLLQS